MVNTKIIATGSYLPSKILSNDDIAAFIDTNDEWIYSRVGIKSRHIALDDEYSSDMGCGAANDALHKAGIDKDSIDMIIVATTTPDKTFPATAAIIHKKLSIKKPIPCFDLQAVCSGFVYGLTVADSLIKSGQCKTILLIGVDKLSSITNWRDRGTCVLFSDGAGAVVLSATEDQGILNSFISCDGNFDEIIHTSGGVSSTQEAGKMIMDGPGVYKKAIEVMTNSVLEVISASNYNISDIDCLIPHQANIRIMQKVAMNLGIDSKRVIATIENYANNSAATIPLAIDYAANHNLLRRGNLFVTVAAGGGFTWGANLIRY